MLPHNDSLALLVSGVAAALSLAHHQLSISFAHDLSL
jgi:hypothetical protein